MNPDLCPHRGHERVDGRCPYHGLYKPDAKCFSRRPLFTRPYTSEVLGRVDRMKGNRFGCVTMDVQCPRELWLQNTMDPNHLRTVHARGFATLFADAPPINIQISEDGNQSSYEMMICGETLSRFRSAFGDAVTSKTFSHAIVGPSLSVTSFLDVFFSVEKISATTGQSCFVETQFFTRKGLDVPSTFLAVTLDKNREILTEDKQICESWARTYECGRDDRNWLPGEERIAAYVRFLRSSER